MTRGMRAGRHRVTRVTRGDHGGIVVGWLLRLVVLLGAMAVVGYDGMSVAVTRMATADDADAAARQAAATWAETRSVDAAYTDAVRRARLGDPAATLPADGFLVAQDGTVHLVLRRTAPTVVLSRVDRLRRWADVEETGSGRPAV